MSAAVERKVFRTFFSGVIGHIMDSDVLHLWRCDESSAAQSLIDEAGNLDIDPINNPGKISGQINGAREFVSSSSQQFRIITGSDQSAVVGEWTFEAWVNPETVINQQVIAHYGGDEAIALEENQILGCELDVDGFPLFIWEHDVGVAEILSSAVAVPTGSFSHIAWRKTANGNDFNQEIFIDGILVAQSLSIASASGGTSADVGWGIGGLGGFHQINRLFNGQIDDIRFSIIPRTNAEILESFRSLRNSASITTYFLDNEDPIGTLTNKTQVGTFLSGGPNTAGEQRNILRISDTFPSVTASNIVAYWQLNATGTDDGSNQHHLTESTTYPYKPFLTFGAPVSSSATHVLDVSDDVARALAHTGAVDLTGNMSVIAAMKLNSLSGKSQFMFGNQRIPSTGVDETSWRTFVADSNVLYADFHSGATNVNIQAVTSPPTLEWFHYVLTREFNGASVTQSIWLNGIVHVSGATAGVEQAALTTNAIFKMGQKHPAVGQDNFDGQISFVQVLDTLLIEGEITQSFSATVDRWKY